MSTQTLTYGSGTSPFDIPSIQRSINDVLASMPPGDRINLVFDVTRQSANAALIVRAGTHFELLGWVTKPWASTLDYGLSGRVRFMAAQEAAPLAFPELRGYYRMFREWNGPFRAAWKAVAVTAGFKVRVL